MATPTDNETPDVRPSELDAASSELLGPGAVFAKPEVRVDAQLPSAAVADLKAHIMIGWPGPPSTLADRSCTFYDPISDTALPAQSTDPRATIAALAPGLRGAYEYYFLTQPPKARRAFNWELTYFCSWSCRHCFQPTKRASSGSRQVEVGPDVVRDVVCAMARWDAEEISLTGGEVLLVRGLADLIRSLRKAVPSARIRLLASGMDLEARPGLRAVLEECAESDVCIRIPVYGPTAEIHDWVTGCQGSLESLSAFVDLARDAGARVTVGVGILRETYPFLEETLAHASELAAGDVSISTIVYPCKSGTHSSDMLAPSQLARLLGKRATAAAAADYLSLERQCASGCLFPTIDPSGLLHACDVVPSAIGDLGTPAISELLDEWAIEREVAAAECETCQSASLCKKCFAFTRASCPEEYRSLVRMAGLIVGVRARQALVAGLRFVDRAGLKAFEPVIPDAERWCR